MQKENSLTVGQWCDLWFIGNRSRWTGDTEGGYCNLTCSHIYTSIGSVELTEQTVPSFYNESQSQGFSTRSVWRVHLLLRRCTDEAARDQLIYHNPVRHCMKPHINHDENERLGSNRIGKLSAHFISEKEDHLCGNCCLSPPVCRYVGNGQADTRTQYPLCPPYNRRFQKKKNGLWENWNL